ncbi:hypothetical protein DEO72_LG10g982 [Vigna unguiculata]|uniref:Uncharacterized protein n=1 Tax=Vigna unguiculata TaxID=3917 RepID=A0A4D6NB27_VIGUN|nr:hypothetical protein DEO72_LG10g982 [Vigna unguiculata]
MASVSPVAGAVDEIYSAFQYHTEAAKDNKQGVYAKHAGETEAHELNVKYSAIE